MRNSFAFFTAALCLFTSPAASAQTYTIQTIAGGGLPTNIPATSANLGRVQGIAVDSSGNIFVTSTNYQGVLRIDFQTGILTLIAGNGVPGFSGDNGPATNAQLNYPEGIAVDPAGNIYVADTQNNRIREISNGVITTVAGTGASGYSGDNGPASQAQLFGPHGLAFDSSGGLYIADSGSARIRKVANGVITTVANLATIGLSSHSPWGVAVDSKGIIYATDFISSAVYRAVNGNISIAAGEPNALSTGNCPVSSASPPLYAAFREPEGLAIDLSGNLYIADTADNCIRELSNNVLTTVAGSTPSATALGDGGPATAAYLSFPSSVAVDAAGNLYIADTGSGRVRKVSNGVITTIAGGGSAGEDGPAMSSWLNSPQGLAVGPSGDIYFGDSGNYRIGRISNDSVTTIAGNGTEGNSGDGGPATNAELPPPSGVALDTQGNLFVSFASADLIREVSNGTISTLAEHRSLSPLGIAVDSSGNVYTSNNSLWTISELSGAVIKTVVPQESATLMTPSGLALDASGNLYIADTGHHRVIALSNGSIVTIAGTTRPGVGGDGGPAASALLNSPQAIALDDNGDLYIAGDNRIRKISNGIISTIAGGSGVAGYSGDNGPAIDAQLNNPSGIGVDSAGNVYFSDMYNNRIRELIPSGTSCFASISPATLQAPISGGNVTLNIQTAATCPWAVQGLPSWITYSGKTTGTGSATVSFDIGANTGVARSAVMSAAGVLIPVSQASAPNLPPAISPNGIVPVYSNLQTIQPGSWISIYGTNLAPATAVWNGDFPTTLGGITVTIDGKPAYLWYVSPNQINLQAPDDTKTGTPVNVVVTAPAGTATTTVTLFSPSPSFSLFDGIYVAGVIPTPDGSGAYGNGSYDLLGPAGQFSFKTRPAKPGETVELFGVGFGPTISPVPAGQVFSGSAPLVNLPQVAINGVSADVTYAGITSAGLYQLNVVVPLNAGHGDLLVAGTVNDQNFFYYTGAWARISVQ